VLQDQTESKLPIAQNIASLFLTTCFPSYFVPARYLLLVLCGNSAQLRETIYGYLYGSQRKDHVNYAKLISIDSVADDADEKVLVLDQTIILPGFKPLIHYIAQVREQATTITSSRSILTCSLSCWTTFGCVFGSRLVAQANQVVKTRCTSSASTSRNSTSLEILSISRSL